MSIVRAHSPQKNRHRPFEPASTHQLANFIRHYREERKAGSAAKAAGITKAQFKHALASDPEFVDKIEEIDGFFLERLEGIAEQLAENHDVPMLKFLLEKRLPARYGRNTAVTVTHKFNSAEDVRKLSDEEFESAAQSLGFDSE